MKEEPSKMKDVQQSINSEELPLTDELVVSFLQDNPDFF